MSDNEPPEDKTFNREQAELVEELADTIETFMEKNVHMARRLYPDVWKRQLAQELVYVLNKNRETENIK